MDDADQQRKIIALRAEFLELQAKMAPLKKRSAPLNVAFGSILKLNGFEAAAAWNKESGCDALNREIAGLSQRASELEERMIVLRPNTLAGVTAVAAILKDYALSEYWKEPEEDRDWDVEILTRFLDSLIELGQGEEPRT
jgi:hypothetical protein